MTKVEFSSTGLIVATGPALKDIPLSFLESFRTYSANGIFCLEGFTPSHYFCSDQYFLENRWDEVAEISGRTEAWIRWPFHAKLGYDARPLNRIPDSWSFEPDIVVGLGGSVLYQCMQVAYWHGIKTLLIVGFNHDYFAYTGLPKHFSDKYVSDAENHAQANIHRMHPTYGEKQKEYTENAYRMARKVFEDDGREIINLTEGSECDIFEMGKIEDWTEG